MGGNYMKLKFSVHKFYWNRATLVHLHISKGFCAITAQLSNWTEHFYRFSLLLDTLQITVTVIAHWCFCATLLYGILVYFCCQYLTIMSKYKKKMDFNIILLKYNRVLIILLSS